MSGWGEFAGRITGIIDGLFGLSPEERVKKIKNKIAALKREKDEILQKGCNDKSADRIIAINDQLRTLEQRLASEAR
jgi:hypothetical protein